nr:hypothetical protein [Tanacetum cinerariifolium]
MCSLGEKDGEMYYDGQSTNVDAPLDIIDVDDNNNFIADEDGVPYDLADSDDEVLANDDDDDDDDDDVARLLFILMSAMVTRCHGGDGGNDDPSRPPQRRPKTTRGGDKDGGSKGVRKETRNLRLKECVDEYGRLKIWFGYNDKGTMLHLGKNAVRWSNLVGELVREFPMYYPSWHSIKESKWAHIMGRLMQHFDLTPHICSKHWSDIKKSIEQHFTKDWRTTLSPIKCFKRCTSHTRMVVVVVGKLDQWKINISTSLEVHDARSEHVFKGLNCTLALTISLWMSLECRPRALSADGFQTEVPLTLILDHFERTLISELRKILSIHLNFHEFLRVSVKYENVVAIRLVDEYSFVIRPSLVGLTSKSCEDRPVISTIMIMRRTLMVTLVFTLCEEQVIWNSNLMRLMDDLLALDLIMHFGFSDQRLERTAPFQYQLTQRDDENATNPPSIPPTQQAPHTLSTIKLPILKKGVSTEDANQKFLRSLPSSWSQVSLIMRTKPGLDTLSFDDLYNNLKFFESDVKGSTASSSSIQNVAFISSDSTSNTNEVSTAYGVSTSSGHNSQREGSSSYTDELMFSFFANQSIGPQLDHDDLERLDEFNL